MSGDELLGLAEYKSADLDQTLIDGLSEVDDITAPVGNVATKKNADRATYKGAALENRAKRHGRNGILIAVLGMLIILILGYMVLGAPYIKSVDDVLKLLSPVQNIVATALGATVAFYFSEQKH